MAPKNDSSKAPKVASSKSSTNAKPALEHKHLHNPHFCPNQIPLLEFALEVHQEKDYSSGSNFTSSQSTPQSKFNAFTWPISSPAMDVIATESMGEADSSGKKPKEPKDFTLSFEGLIPIDQLKDFILGTIKDKYDETPKSSSTYVKPYIRRIDLLKMSAGYQPSKFQQFNGKGNPKQHIAHFVKTCNNATTDGGVLVKQFVRMLTSNAFNWYYDLEPVQ
ncbi:hypothetical protein Vadar_022207 [Vaccinium darrowii]|uniref:Uncharacterized protein n=1 Tax=Vaccinium darrowii TaxID=229202 RepID=A0ACB7Z6G6_9ERIC|nr:hypothetical protein Vadar_022207 [Vaccinium darrowii]